MANSEEIQFAVGTRCVFEGYYGTIRYIGEVPPTNGVWLGVDWDDPSRGKHSGEHEGVHYFKTRVAGSGSFVRPKKVSLGCTFMEAIEKKYGDSSVDLNDDEMIVDGQLVEMVGAEKITKKQSEYDKLLDVSLREMHVSSAGPKGEIAATAPNIQLLNLSQSPLITSWQTVADIASQLKLLTCLELSEDIGLPPLTENAFTLAPAFSSVKVLYINKMGLVWSEVVAILRLVPALEELHVCENSIDNLRYDGAEGSRDYLPSNLQLLNLEKNQLSDWSDILRLEGQVQKLRRLILNGNQLPSIFLHDTDKDSPKVQSDLFPSLRSLSISKNNISQWPSIACLASLKSLVDLKFKDNPLLKEEPGFTTRQLLIAQLVQITFLNGSDVSVRERQLAERYYIKRYATEWLGSKSKESALQGFLRDHPRFPQLVDVHGLPEEVLLAHKPATTPLKNELISVTVKCPDHPDAKTLSKKLPGTMTVQKLKGLLQRLYKVDSSNQSLSYLDEKINQEFELDDDLKQLSFFSIESGDTILLRW